MPRTLHGKPLTDREHGIWQAAFNTAKAKGANEPGGKATQAVKNYRKNRKHAGRRLMEAA